MEGLLRVTAVGRSLSLARHLPVASRTSFHGLRVLCLDGGGMRGVVTLRVLRALEQAANNTPICDLFDLIVGTSTGGILAAALGPLRLTIAACEQLYTELGDVLFADSGTLSKVLGLLSSETAMYPRAHEKLEELLRAVANENLSLGGLASMLPRFACVTGVDAGGGNYAPYVFRTYGPAGGKSFSHLPAEPTGDIKLWQALRATSAAPMYFKPMVIGKTMFVDGGVAANNPSLVAIEEAVGLNVPIHCMLSVGTGYTPVVPPTKGFFSKKIVPAQHLIDEATNSNKVHVEVSTHTELHGRYFRFNVPIGAADLAETNENVLATLRLTADKYIQADMPTGASLRLAAMILNTPSFVPASLQSASMFSQVIKTHHDASWKDLIEQATGEIVMSFAYLGRNIRDSSKEMAAFVKRGGRIRAVFPDHDNPLCMDALRRLMPWQFKTEEPRAKILQSLEFLRSLEQLSPGCVEVRLLPRLQHYSLYILGSPPRVPGESAEHRRGMVSVFQEKESSPLHPSVRSPLMDVGDTETLAFLEEEFNALWNEALKV